ncbi:hypothetical protein ABIE26_001176 [Pedobacter africanus]|uniref:Uncharacterized protein n=1 Tax=Pedobacter africanus TaxID=151894 RepID=A0ACC6KT10_9SPHI|nr:hypothetical protein [Pedobacter africanus]MDR6782336.1 hypothetical protein [Pedobacter africanus]
MKVNTPIHLVKPKNYDSFDEVYAVFDSKEKAAKFVEKFKSRPDLEIIDGVLNPDFNLEQKAEPYYISLARTGSMPKDIFMCDYNRNLEARQEEYNICFYGGTEIHQGLFITKIFALNEKDALRKALLIRNSAIKNGEWDLAWERHKIQQTRLNLRGR